MSETDSVCVDACFVLKLLLPEAGSDAADALWSHWVQDEVAIYAPAHLLFEAAHGVRKAVRSGRMSSERGDQAFERLIGLGVTLVCLDWIDGHDVWHRFVRRFDYLVTPYDAAYLHVAEVEGCDFWTADERLVRTVAGELTWVRSLSEERSRQ